MSNHNEFFNRLNNNISNAQNSKSLVILEKIGRKYVDNVPGTTDPKIKRHIKRQWRHSLILIKKKKKQVND